MKNTIFILLAVIFILYITKSLISLILIIPYLLICIITIFNPKIDKIITSKEVSYVVYYTIKGKVGESVRNFFILYKKHI